MPKTHKTHSATATGRDPLPGVADPDRLEARRLALFATLGLPRSFFRGREILQIGGPAESALQYALWGGKVTLVATDPKLGEYAENLFLRHRQTLKSGPQEALLEAPAHMARFEFVACEEPLDYSQDPLRDVDVILKNLARGGVVMAAIPESHCAHRRRLMQQIVRLLGANRDEMERHGSEWFGHHVEATARLRGLPRETVLRDLFVTQCSRPVDLSDVCATFREHGMTYLGSNPRIGGHCRAVSSDPFDYLAHRAHYRFLERLWATFGGAALGDKETADPATLHRDVEMEFASLTAIANRVAQRDIDDVLIERLRMGGDGFDHFVVLASR